MGHLPDEDGTLRAHRDKNAPVRTDDDPGDGPAVSYSRRHLLSLIVLPHLDEAVRSATGKENAVTLNVNRVDLQL